ncbi:hypothetical protein IT570_07150 [Candidatus Sumerlaeota bacterium]|nr:hypothetical protein [Candidatus Sumerlaeota bacterium]
MSKKFLVPVACMMLVVPTHRVLAQPADFSWTFDSTNGSSDFRVTSASGFSDAALYSGAFPADDPTINLQVGKRYEVNNPNASSGHPLAIIASASSPSNDIILLSQSGTGSFESDNDVAYVETGTTMTFTVTQALLDAMNSISGGTHTPGYRCQIHSNSMRGAFNVTAPLPSPTPSPSPSPTATPIPTPVGNASWVFDHNGLADYRLNSPASVSAPWLYSDSFPALDPTITLRVNWRYSITLMDGNDHPIEIVSFDPSNNGNDDILLAMLFDGLLQNDPAINFTNDNASQDPTIAFTLTPGLAAAMSAKRPGYQCSLHLLAMKGFFYIMPQSVEVLLNFLENPNIPDPSEDGILDAADLVPTP